MSKKITSTPNISKTKDTKASAKTVAGLKSNEPVKSDFAFSKMNYYIMFAGLVFIIIGFMMMTGGGSDNPNVFNEKEIFSFRRITLAPILVLAGYVIEIFAILYKPKD